MKLFTVQYPPLICYLLPLRAKYLPQYPILENPQPMFLPRCELPSITITGKITVLYISFFKFLESKLEDKRFWTGWYQIFPEFTSALNVFITSKRFVTYLFVSILSCILSVSCFTVYLLSPNKLTQSS